MALSPEQLACIVNSLSPSDQQKFFAELETNAKQTLNSLCTKYTIESGNIRLDGQVQQKYWSTPDQNRAAASHAAALASCRYGSLISRIKIIESRGKK